VLNFQKKWFDAKAECKKNGGDLASLESPEENLCARFHVYSAGKKILAKCLSCMIEIIIIKTYLSCFRKI
jgi:hypothetical protein